MSKKKKIELTEENIQAGWVELPPLREAKSRTIGVRLSEANTREALALKIIDDMPAKDKRAFMVSAIISQAGRPNEPLVPAVNVDSGAFADEVERMRNEFNQRILDLTDTMVAMFETMKQAGVGVGIEMPDKPIEKREVANNLINAYKGRYKVGG